MGLYFRWKLCSAAVGPGDLFPGVRVTIHMLMCGELFKKKKLFIPLFPYAPVDALKRSALI
jgi:hypothetical protein